MKHTLKLLTLSSLMLTLFWSCKKDEYKDFYLGGKAPVMTSITNASADSVALHYADSDKVALQLRWTNPNYQFTTGISSQDVNYQIEIDTTGSDFSSPQKKVISVSKDLSYSITEAKLNDILLNQLGLKDSVPHHIEIRVISGIGSKPAVPLISNVFKFSAVPYAIPPKVKPPSSGKLYITGDATPGGWQTGGDPASVPANQEFTKISPTKYEITIGMTGTGGKQYLFIPVAGSWDHKYACKKTADQSPDGGNFGYDWGGNFPAPATSGTYKIVVDFQRGKYTVTKQ